MRDVVLQPGRDRSVLRRHPWLLSGSVADAGDAEAGEAVRLVSAQGEALGYGHYSPASQIRVRILSFGKDWPGENLIEERIEAAVRRREADPLLAGSDAVRLINAEGDGLPGLVVDRYADTVVARLSTAGTSVRRERIARALERVTGVECGVERADAPAARREGVAPREGVLWGEGPTGPVEISESGLRYGVDVLHGQKTGFYLDQRDARARVVATARGRRVLDLFSYTGGFAVAAAAGGAASLTLVDSSADALDRAREHIASNAPDLEARFAKANAFEWVRGDAGQYDLLIIDPPPLARRKSDVTKATRAYKDVLMHALRRAAPGAQILCFSCSHHVGPDLFRKVCFGASVDAGRPLRVLGELGLPSDHPVSLDHPEGRYLSGLVLEA